MKKKKEGQKDKKSNSILTNSSITLRKELDIGKDIVKERNMIKKEKR